MSQVSPKVAFAGSDERLLEALVARRPGAWLAFYDRFAPYVLSVLRKVLGADAELEDLVQEVFSRALEGVGRVRHADKLKPWLRSLTVFTARSLLKKRRWRRWLPFGGPAGGSDEDSLENSGLPALTTSDAVQERLVLKRVQVVLDRLPVDERLCFTLRHFEGLELTEVAQSVGVSLSTAKRRLWRAEEVFNELVKREPEIRGWLAEGRSFSS
ncbi:MAG: sigma-70 family RNA polymerase sigma factor [Myxococcales bacterium]|nr:sigma-70 family RNA polymerase sigma factor [Myxococcales bacterium]